MKKEWILWNALKKPEQVKGDERMELIEWKSYYWCYKGLMLCMYLLGIAGPSFLEALEISMNWREGIWREGISQTLFRALILELALTVELGRFLYSCYHGNQESFDRNRGKQIFLGYGIVNGFFGCMMLGIALGFGHPLPWLLLIAGTLFYWGLCHLSYLHYGLLLEDATVERACRWERWVPAVCGLLLVLYYITLDVTVVSASGYGKAASLSETEQGYLKEIQEGKDSYYRLTSAKLEYFYDTDAEEEAAFYSDGSMAHAYYWTTPERGYTQALNPLEENEVCMESYRDEKGEWYVSFCGRWMSEREYMSQKMQEVSEMEEAPEMPAIDMEPETGILDINPKAAASVTKEAQGEGYLYTVRYNDAYETVGERVHVGDSLKNVRAEERYFINEYGVLMEYELTETGTPADTDRISTRHKAFRVLNVSRRENEREVEKLISQYSR